MGPGRATAGTKNALLRIIKSTYPFSNQAAPHQHAPHGMTGQWQEFRPHLAPQRDALCSQQLHSLTRRPRATEEYTSSVTLEIWI